MMLKSNLIVEKSDSIEIGKFDGSEEYIVTHKKLGNRIIINQKTLDVLNLVDGKASLDSIVSRYNAANNPSKISIDVAYELLYEKLGRQGVIINNKLVLKKKEIASYLALSFTLVNKNALNFFIKIVAPIILFEHFYKILFSSLAMVSFIVISNFSELTKYANSIELGHWFLYFLINGGVLFMHEFGHAAACKKLGAEPGSIGFGFYLLSPVMFADVSDVWKLKRKERIYVNFAGIYVELFIALILSIIYLFTKDTALLIVCSFILLSSIINLNPLLRYDGYWILSDATNTPNLRKVSMQKLYLFVGLFLGKNKMKFSTKETFLIVYAIASVFFIFAFLALILINDPHSLFSFPSGFALYWKEIIIGNKSFILYDLEQFILPLLFYFIVLKFLISRWARNKKVQL